MYVLPLFMNQNEMSKHTVEAGNRVRPRFYSLVMFGCHFVLTYLSMPMEFGTFAHVF